MEGRTTRPSAYVAAALLAAVTLGVFYRLQDYGPESALRRFHSDVINKDTDDLQRVTIEPIESANAFNLERFVYGIMHAGARYELVRMDRSPDQVRAAVIYRVPNSPKDVAMIWVVERTPQGWRVNADKTVTIIHDFQHTG